jgi:hypothetical protein
LWALAHAPVFDDERAIEVIGRYSALLEDAFARDVSPKRMERLRKEALKELRGESYYAPIAADEN